VISVGTEPGTATDHGVEIGRQLVGEDGTG
jgi:hypothetical protein